MSDVHNAAIELQQAISRVDPSTSQFQKLDFNFETSIQNASFGVVDNSVVFRFGSDELAGYALPIENPDGGTVVEGLEKFLSAAEQIREYQLVTNGTVNREVLQELKANLNSEFVMIQNGKISDIKLTKIRMDDDSSEVTIFYDKLMRTGRYMPLFEDLHKLKPDSRLELFLKPAESKS